MHPWGCRPAWATPMSGMGQRNPLLCVAVCLTSGRNVFASFLCMCVERRQSDRAVFPGSFASCSVSPAFSGVLLDSAGNIFHGILLPIYRHPLSPGTSRDLRTDPSQCDRRTIDVRRPHRKDEKNAVVESQAHPNARQRTTRTHPRHGHDPCRMTSPREPCRSTSVIFG